MRRRRRRIGLVMATAQGIACSALFTCLRPKCLRTNLGSNANLDFSGDDAHAVLQTTFTFYGEQLAGGKHESAVIASRPSSLSDAYTQAAALSSSSADAAGVELADVTGNAETPSLTYFGINTFSLDIGGKRLLVDPLLVGDLVFFGQEWAFRGERSAAAKAAAASLEPEAVAQNFDAIVLTQGLDDHSHRPTLKRIKRQVPIIASPTAAVVVKGLGFETVTVLRPGESSNLGPHLRITAVPGSVVGPPWQDPENGYVFTDERPGGLSLGAEPHGNFLGPALGTSFKCLPKPPPLRVDALLLPFAAQRLSGDRKSVV